MFFFGLLSTPLPYLLLAGFYFIGFATGMFKGNIDSDPNTQIQVKNIQVEPNAQSIEKSGSTFYYHEYNFHKRIANSAISAIQPSPVGQNEKLIYFVHELKIPNTSTSAYNFCRPPPIRS